MQQRSMMQQLQRPQQPRRAPCGSSGSSGRRRRRAPLVVSAVLATGGPVVTAAASGVVSTIVDTVVREVDVGSDASVYRSQRDVLATSYVSRQRLNDPSFDPSATDDEGLPIVYNEAAIAAYWRDRPGELGARWAKFAAVSAPWLTKLANAVITGRLEARQVELARDAVDNLERLGPTFIKLGQILSIRPDVLPPPVLAELGKLQDRIEPFSTAEARAVVARDLGASSVEEIFSEFSPEPIAAASLAQVYRARVRATGQEVAVKVQRPNALSVVSQDLYVLRRSVGVYEQLVTRFTAQTTDYQALLSTFAEGLFTELDFANEALNSLRMAQLLAEAEGVRGDRIVIPKPLLGLTSRRVLTMEWVTGVKLTSLPKEEIRDLIGVGQDAFLCQLLQAGFMHGDPHPGNLLKVTEGPDAGKLALLDFGLVAEIPAEDRAAMVSAVVHLANRNWDALVTDFVDLGFLPRDCDRVVIIPVMERVLGPYLRGGGARAYNFQALSQDLLMTTMQIPFSVPPYMSLLARSVATLEGIALTGDPEYQMVAQAYPFVAKKLLRDDASGTGALLRDLVYDESGRLRPNRLSSLLQAALGYVSERAEGFVDLDAVPDAGASAGELLRFVLSPAARELRPLLVGWLASGADLVLRDRARKAAAALPGLLAPPPLPFAALLGLPSLPAPPPPPVLVPGRGLMPLPAAVELLAPPLSGQEVVYLNSLQELLGSVLGVPPAQLESPGLDTLLTLLTQPGEQARELQQALLDLANGGGGGGGSAQEAAEARTAAADVAVGVVESVAAALAQRASVPVDTLFPMRRALLASVARGMGASEALLSPPSAPQPQPQQPQQTVAAAAAAMAGVGMSNAGVGGGVSSSSSSSNGSGSHSVGAAAPAHSANGNGGHTANGASAAALREPVLAAAAGSSTTSSSSKRVLRMRQL